MNGHTLAARLEAVVGPGTAAFGLIVVASLLLLGLINPVWRDRIMHWRWRDPLPGCRAFTSVGPLSSHVSMTVLEAQYEPLQSAGYGAPAIVYCVALFMIYALYIIAAKNYSWRVVQHVLALASSKTRADGG